MDGQSNAGSSSGKALVIPKTVQLESRMLGALLTGKNNVKDTSNNRYMKGHVMLVAELAIELLQDPRAHEYRPLRPLQPAQRRSQHALGW